MALLYLSPIFHLFFFSVLLTGLFLQFYLRSLQLDGLIFALCDRQNPPPPRPICQANHKDNQVLILTTCDYVVLHGKTLNSQMKLRWLISQL